MLQAPIEVQTMSRQNLMQFFTPILKEAIDKTFLVAKFFCGLHVTNAYFCSFVLGQGPSMIPTINLTGTLVLVEKLSTRFGKVGTGDVVLIRSVVEPKKTVLKRITGVEGDAVTYLVPKSEDYATVVVPKGHVWIEGDNPHISRDSRMFGPVPYGLIEGKACWAVWPPENFGPLGKQVQQLNVQKEESLDKTASVN